MTAISQRSNLREIDARMTGDGLHIGMLWDAEENAVIIVASNRQGDWTAGVFPPEMARDAFEHPFVYFPIPETVGA